MTKAPRIVVFEPEANGHQVDYLRHILLGINKRFAGARVTILTAPQAAKHPNYLRLEDEFSSMVTIKDIPSTSKRNILLASVHRDYERQWREAERLRRGLSEVNIELFDFFIIPYLESIGLMQLYFKKRLFRSRPWATIGLGLRFHHRDCGIAGPRRKIDALQKIMFRRVICVPSLKCFGTIDVYLSKYANNKKVFYCPEPCAKPTLHSVTESRSFYGIRPETFVVLVYGVLDRRKCIDVLLSGAAQARNTVDLTIFLAGPQDAHVASILQGKPARKLRELKSLVEVNRFILSGQDMDPLGAADITWVFYEPNFVYSSSVLVRSGLAERAVVARRQGIIGRLVDERNLGLTLGSDTPEEVAAALIRLAHDATLRDEMGKNGAHAFSENTPDNFVKPILDAIEVSLSS